MIQFTHAEQKTAAVTKLHKSTHQIQSIFLSALPTSSRVSSARWHTRTQRRARIQRPNALKHRLCTVHNGTRSGEGQPTEDSKQRRASTASHTVMSKTLRPSRRGLRHQTCRATHHLVQNNKNTSVKTPSIASLTGWAGSLAATTSAPS